MMPPIVVVLTSMFIATNAGLVRIPKIYNAVISSDQNLSPSHVIPVVEPVFRTTALGVAFPPIIVQQHPVQQHFINNIPKEVSNCCSCQKTELDIFNCILPFFCYAKYDLFIESTNQLFWNIQDVAKK